MDHHYYHRPSGVSQRREREDRYMVYMMCVLVAADNLSLFSSFYQFSTHSLPSHTNQPMDPKPVTFSKVMAAHKAIERYAYETPIIRSNALTYLTGHQEVLLKCENLQRSGSYQFRGMMNKVIQEKETDLGVDTFVTHSTGNSGIALACAAKHFQSVAHVVGPDTEKHLKAYVTHYNGEMHTCKLDFKDRQKKVNEVIKELKDQKKSVVVVHPYNDRAIIAGFGTVGIELMEQTNCGVDCVVAAGAGGALLAGISIAVKQMKPHVAVFAAVSNFIDNKQVFKRGEFPVRKQVFNPKGVFGQGKFRMSDDSYEVVRRHVDGTIVVTKEEIHKAFRCVYERCKLVIDLHAATAVAAVLQQPPELRKYRRVCIIISGGNVELGEIPRLAAML